jgi:DNA-binding MarR family transcriptional regulator
MVDLCSIRKLQTAIRNFEDMLKKETGLSLNDALLLCAVRKGICEPSLLAKELELSPSRLTRILDTLESRNLIDRCVSETDRRGVTVALTQEGTELIGRYSCSDLSIPDELAFTQTDKNDGTKGEQ